MASSQPYASRIALTLLCIAMLPAIPRAAGNDLILWGWGDDSFGALGDGATSPKAVPVRVTAIEKPISVKTGATHTLAMGSDGNLYAWGGNQYGQLGDGTRRSRLQKVRVEGLSGVRSFACGADHSLALKENGTVWAWGSNASGQLGLGASGDRTSPAKVRGLSEIVALRAGSAHSLALDASGRVWAWGDNRYGQLGPTGPSGFSDVPIQVGGLQGVRTVEAGGRHSVALLADGSVWAWGDNLFGQLGAQTPNATSPEPVRVAGLPAAEAIRAGLEHSLALLRDATLWAWGANFQGQLGDGTAESRHEARAVAGLSGVVAFAAGGAHGLAVLSDETLWVWGSNRYGQLGDGTLEDRLLPVPISDLTAVKEVRAGWDRSFAVTEKRLTVASMKKKVSPFRIVVTGAHFDENIKVFIHGWQWPLVDWVTSQKLVLRGKESLKSSVPRGTPTEFRFQNPDGESLTLWWQWD